MLRVRPVRREVRSTDGLTPFAAGSKTQAYASTYSFFLDTFGGEPVGHRWLTKRRPCLSDRNRAGRRTLRLKVMTTTEGSFTFNIFARAGLAAQRR